MRSLCFSMLWLFAIFILPQALASELPALAEIKEWQVSWGGRPRAPFIAPDGKVWFCGQAGNYIAFLEPTSGQFKRFEVPESSLHII